MEGHAYVLLGATGGRLGAPHLRLDAAEPSGVKGTIEHCLGSHGRFDGIVNTVGSILLRPAHMAKVEDFVFTVRQNLRTAFAPAFVFYGLLWPVGEAVR